MNKRQLQFELWKECNSKCKFCYSGNDIICTLDVIKTASVSHEKTVETLVSLTGGK